MDKSIHARLQYFSDQLHAEMTASESMLLIGNDKDQERKMRLKADLIEEILNDFETLFADIIVKKE